MSIRGVLSGNMPVTRSILFSSGGMERASSISDTGWATAWFPGESGEPMRTSIESVTAEATASRTSGSPLTATGSLVLSDTALARAEASSASSPSVLRHMPSAPISFHMTAHSQGSSALPENIEATSSSHSEGMPWISPRTIGLLRRAPS